MTFYIGKEPTIGNYAKMDSISAVNGQATYNLLKGGVAFAPQSANHVICSLNSIIQNPGSSFTISGSQITFASNLATGDSIDFILVLGDVLSIGVPSDDTIDSAKLKTNSVIEAKIQNNAVTTDKINNDAVTIDKINLISTTSAPSLEAKGTSGQTDGYIQLNCEQNTHGIKLKSPPHSAGQSYTLTFPSTAPARDKFLKTDNSGNLSFAQVSSDFVLLASTDITTSTALVEFDGLFTSTYKNYKLICSGLLPVTNAARLRMQGKESGSYVTGGYSYTIGGDFVYNSTDGGESDEKNSANSYGLITSEMSNTTSEVNGFDMTIYDPLGSHYKAFNWHSHNWGSALTNLHRNFIGSLMIRNSTADLTAIKFYFDSGNIAKGNFKLWGIK